MKPGWCSAAPACLALSLAYAVIIDALAIPLTLMLIGLIFRGVAFEFRFQATPSHRPFWDRAFMAVRFWPPSPRGGCRGGDQRLRGQRPQLQRRHV
jgi:hypothetical protein